jgi:hypothetical protein
MVLFPLSVRYWPFIQKNTGTQSSYEKGGNPVFFYFQQILIQIKRIHKNKRLHTVKYWCAYVFAATPLKYQQMLTNSNAY